jgi:hypothetical protein
MEVTMPYYAYMGGFCGYCGADLGLIDQAGGRNRHYCNDAHRQAAYRRRKESEKHNAVLLRNGELQSYWAEHGITGAILTKLQDILFSHGKDAARAATDAVILARQLERDAGTSERTDLIEQVMNYGEACSFEALDLRDARIERGLAAWSLFCSAADNSMLRLVVAVIRQRQGAAYRRRRLAEIGGDSI